jgi:integrase
MDQECTQATETAKPKRTKRPLAKTRGLFERDGEWWICWACNQGHIHREKIGPKGLALTEYQKRKVAVKTAGFCLTQARRDRPTLFSVAEDKYLAWARKERPRSVMFREKALKHLKGRFGVKTLDAITKADVEAYQASRRDEGAAPGTVNRERSVLSHLFTKANTWGLVKTNPVTGSERQAEANEKPRPLTPDEEARLFAVLPKGKRSWSHWRELVTLALHTGLRLGELRHQAWRDIDLPGATLTVTRPKSGKAETIPLNATARAVLAGLERTSPLVFPALPKKLTDLFKRYVAKAKLPKEITFHCLRDTYISRLAPHVSTPTLMTLARHRDYRTTRRYVQVDGKHLRDAVECLNPGAGSTPTSTEVLTVSQVLESMTVVDKVE